MRGWGSLAILFKQTGVGQVPAQPLPCPAFYKAAAADLAPLVDLLQDRTVGTLGFPQDRRVRFFK